MDLILKQINTGQSYNFFLMSLRYTGETKQGGTYLYSSHASRYVVNSMVLLELLIWILNMSQHHSNPHEKLSGLMDPKVAY